MNYNLVYTRRAEKDIKKLDSSIKGRIGNALLKLQDNPLLYSEKLSDPALGTYKFRIGDYRVIFDIEGNVLLFSGLDIEGKFIKDSGSKNPHSLYDEKTHIRYSRNRKITIEIKRPFLASSQIR